MANLEVRNARMIMKNDTAANWAVSTLVPLKGEMCLESDTNKFKFGDGINTFANLSYAGTLVSSSSTNGNIQIDGVETTVYTLPTADASTLGGVKSQAAATGAVVVANDGTMSVAKVADSESADEADKLATSRTIAITGDATGSTGFDGSADTSISLTLANSGVTAGTYAKVTVDAKGRVTAGDAQIALSDVSDAGTAASKNTGTASGNVPVLDSNGKLDTAVLPSLAISETFVVASEADMLALTAQIGDVAIRTDINKTFILAAAGASTLANWKEVLTPAAPVQSVNTKTGNVTLDTDDIAEGSTNLYYTDARVATKVGTMNTTDMADGATVLHTTDTIVFDCGNSGVSAS